MTCNMAFNRKISTVIPALVAGIHRASFSDARGWLDPGHKARDDKPR